MRVNFNKMVSNQNLSEKNEKNFEGGFVNLGYENEKSGSNIDVNSTEKRNVDFDDLIPHFGNFGTYQIILFILLGPYTIFYVFVYFTQIFIILTPIDYWCNVPELLHLELGAR